MYMCMDVCDCVYVGYEFAFINSYVAGYTISCNFEVLNYLNG